jgi:hypothetical protein
MSALRQDCYMAATAVGARYLPCTESGVVPGVCLPGLVASSGLMPGGRPVSVMFSMSSGFCMGISKTNSIGWPGYRSMHLLKA